MSETRLMDLCHGGGCGCKLDPAVLSGLLGPPLIMPDELLVGNTTRDDACAWRQPDGSCIVATADFFLPVVHDPADFGSISATNAISDVYAMGARPLFALALVGMPVGKISSEDIGRILAGGEQACKRAGIPVAGGHSIDAAEPLYGLAVVGRCEEKHLMRNTHAEAGDAIVLGKPLGIGILSNALKAGQLEEDGYRQLVENATRLNAVGAELAERGLARALTDVTGFGLLGHLLEMCEGASLGASVSFGSIPLLAAARQLAEQGLATGASGRNWRAYGASVRLPAEAPEWWQTMLTDPQTSGGLLAACPAERVSEALQAFADAGFAEAATIGSFAAGEPAIAVQA